jgi:uncharacterized phage protein (TIGR01671 family)
MREISFRGKYGNNPWIYGSLVARNRNNNGIQAQNSSVAILVDDGSVGQYTGMNDSMGKEIYEGDIVRTSDNDDELAVVEWDDEDLRFTVTHGNVVNGLGEGYYSREVEVIGNMYDNPELLGGADDEH